MGTCAAATFSQGREHFWQADRLRNGRTFCHGRNLDRNHSETSRSQPQRDVHARIGIWGLSYPQQEGDVPGRHIAGTHDSWFRNTQNTLANRIMLRWGRDPGDQEAWRKGQSCKGLARGSRQGLGTHRRHRLLFEECACNRLQQQASCTSTRELVSRHHSCEGTT